MTLKEKLSSIRSLIDTEVKRDNIDAVVEQGSKLSNMMGLSAECKAEARKEFENAKLAAIIQLENKKYTPSVLLKIAEAMCADELEQYEYADRLNAGITHQLDFLRSVISLHKEELNASLRN